MNNDTINRILTKFVDNELTIQIRISGNSMAPILSDNEVVSIKKKRNYMPGDILVFRYKMNVLLAHRLLIVKNNQYYCKGDNSFRIEDISYDQIIGVVLLDYDKNNNTEFIHSSFKIGQLFRKCKYDEDLILSTEEYKSYSAKYLTLKGEW